MQVAIVSTSRDRVRDEIWGWSFDDASLLVRKGRPGEPGIFIGYTPAPKDIPHYGTVLEMLADGWKLLAPPTDESWTNEEGKKIDQYVWWLTREPLTRLAPPW